MHRSVAIVVLAAIAAASAGPLLNKCVLEPNTDADRFAKLSTLNVLFGEILSTESEGSVYYVSICRPIPRSFFDSGKLVGSVKMTAEFLPSGAPRHSIDLGNIDRTNIMVNGNDIVLTYVGGDEVRNLNDSCKGLRWKTYVKILCDPLVIVDILTLIDEDPDQSDTCEVWFELKTSKTCNKKPEIPSVIWKDDLPHHEKQIDHRKDAETKEINSNQNPLRDQSFNNENNTFDIVTDSLQIEEEEANKSNQNYSFGFEYLYSYIIPFMNTIPKSTNKNNPGPNKKKDQLHQNVFEDKSADNYTNQFNGSKFDSNTDTEKSYLNQNNLKNKYSENIPLINLNPNHNNEDNNEKKVIYPISEGIQNSNKILPKYQSAKYVKHSDNERNEISSYQNHLKDNQPSNEKNENVDEKNKRIQNYKNYNFPHNKSIETHQSINLDDKLSKNQNENFHTQSESTKEKIEYGTITQIITKSNPLGHTENESTENSLNKNDFFNNKLFNDPKEPNHENKENSRNINREDKYPGHENSNSNLENKVTKEEIKNSDLTHTSLKHQPSKHGDQSENGNIIKMNSNHNTFKYNKSFDEDIVNSDKKNKRIDSKINSEPKNSNNHENYDLETNENRLHNENKENFQNMNSEDGNIHERVSGNTKSTVEKSNNEENEKPSGKTAGKINLNHMTLEYKSSDSEINDFGGHKKVSDRGKKSNENDKTTNSDEKYSTGEEGKYDYYFAKNISNKNGSVEGSESPSSGTEESNSNRTNSQNVYPEDASSKNYNENTGKENSTVYGVNRSGSWTPNSDNSEKKSSDNGDETDRKIGGKIGDKNTVERVSNGKNGSKNDYNSTVIDGNSTIAADSESSKSEPSKTNESDSSAPNGTPRIDKAENESSKSGDGSQQVADGKNDGNTVGKNGSTSDRNNSAVAGGNSTIAVNTESSKNESSITINGSDSSAPNGTPRSDNGEKTSSKSGDGNQQVADGDKDGKTVDKNGSKNDRNSAVIDKNNGTIAVNTKSSKTEPSNTISANDSRSDASSTDELSPSKKIVNGSVSDANERELNGTGTYQTNNVHKIVRSETTESELNAETSESSIVSKSIKTDNSNSEGEPKTTDNTDGGSGNGFGSLFSKLFPNGFPSLSATTIFAGLGSLSVIGALVGTAVNRFYYKRSGTDQIPFKETFQSIQNNAKDFLSKILCCFGGGGGDGGSDEPNKATERSPLLQPKNVSAPKVVDETSRKNEKRMTSSDSGRSESGDDGNYGSMKNEENVSSAKKYRKKKSKSTTVTNMSTSDSGPENEKCKKTTDLLFRGESTNEEATNVNSSTKSGANDSPTFASILKKIGKLAIKPDAGDVMKTAETLKSDVTTPVSAPQGVVERKRVSVKPDDDVRVHVEIETEGPKLRLKTDEIKKQSSNASDTVTEQSDVREPKSGTGTDVTISEDQIDIPPYEENTENSDFGTPPTTPIVRDAIKLPGNADDNGDVDGAALPNESRKDGNGFISEDDAPNVPKQTEPEPESIDDLIGMINEEITEKFEREVHDLELEKTDKISDGSNKATDVETTPNVFDTVPSDTKTIADDKDPEKVDIVNRTNENEPFAESSRDVISLPYNKYYKRAESKLQFLGLDVKKEEQESGAPGGKTAVKNGGGGGDNDDVESVAGPEEISYMDSGADSVHSDVFEDTVVDQEPRDATSTSGGRSGSLSPSTDSQTGTAASVDCDGTQPENDRKKFGFQLGIGKSGVNVSVGEKKMGIGRSGWKFGKRDAGGGAGGEDDGMMIKVDKSDFKMNRNRSVKSKGEEPAGNETKERAAAAAAAVLPAKKFKKTLSMPNFNVFKRSISMPPNFAEIAENEASTSSAGVGGKPSSSSDRSAGLLIFGKSRSKSTGFLETEDVTTTDVNVLSSFIDFERQASASNLSTGHRFGHKTDDGAGNVFEVDTATAVPNAGAEDKFRSATLLSAGESAIKSLTAGALGAVVKPSSAGTSWADLEVGSSMVEKDGGRKSTAKSDAPKKSATAKTGRGKKKDKTLKLKRPF